ncbi:cold shock domain-containing protein [Pseudomonas sp. P66]|uniref:Cold shock domain-containing protein n=1 Tax=Pseudomonas arcuscaelestis TaxID=2710591 RepID=A0ABS2BY77_9PSED|nr:cold shock domain-containing protein [Pseudomonas arcuscaelestis]MBM5458576.1 cold shock domain-containing protein [Pseudomonas arcuscaelestis]
MPQENIAAGSIEGEVVSFVQAKGYGFVSGDDGEHYFFHQSEVVGGAALGTGQRVSFIPVPTPRGSKATQVVPGTASTLIYVDPSDFVWSKGGPPKGMEVVLGTGSGWGQSNDPNQARELLKGKAREFGANAVLNARMEKFTGSAACSNYRWTMHRFYGDFAVVQVVTTSSDPAAIADSENRMLMLREWWESKQAPQSDAWAIDATETRLIEPEKVTLVVGLLLSWSRTLLKILGLTGLFFWRKAAAFVNERLSSSSAPGKKKPDDLGE